MTCDELQHALVFSNTTPSIGEVVTCMSTVKNLSSVSSQECFYIVYSANNTPFFTSMARNNISINETQTVTTKFQSASPGVVQLCADLRCYTPAPLNNIQIFPSDHVWNTPVDTMPVHAKSSTYINSIRSYGDNFLHYYTGHPINVVDSSVIHEQVVFTTSYSPETGDGYPIPHVPIMEGGSDITLPGDHHLHIVDRDANRLYELYDPHKDDDGVWYAASGAIFDLGGYALRKLGWSSADAAGLPIIPGIIRYDELMSPGGIKHALRFNVTYTDDSYVFPARNKAGQGHTDGTLPSMGQRFRLKASFDTSGFSPQSRAILNVLKKYGAMVSDNGAQCVLSMEPDRRWNWSDTHQLASVPTTALEAVDITSLIINPDSAQVIQPY